MTLFRASPETELLVQLLRDAKNRGETFISYRVLSEAIESSVQTPPGYTYLRSARHRVQEEDQDVWACAHGRGLYLAPHEERAKIGEKTAKKVRRQVHRDKKVLETTDISSLDEDSLNEFNSSATRLAILNMASSDRVGRRIEQQVEDLPKITTEQTIELLRSAYKQKPSRPAGNPRPPSDSSD